MAISLYELSQRISSSMPLGTIVPYYGTDEPSGWKICDGRSCAGSELAKKLGINNVPDLRGRFIRMIGGNAAGMAVAQDMMIQSHNHKARRANNAGGRGGGNVGGADTPDSWNDTSYSGGVETRPINMAFNYIIKINTNVILYYVSNIIYKAIAIGKSLLSRSKEEVRRTMAISLNNHEDRIVKLENIGVSKLELLANYMYYDTPTPIRFKQYDALYIINSLGAASRVDEFNFCYLVPRNLLERDIDFCKFKDVGVEESNSTGSFMRIHLSGDQVTVKLTGAYDNGVYKGSQIYVYGLKLYYNFSYNIYNLTQILFNSPLLGLSSQKGGARTIWLLVLTITKTE